MKWPLTPSVAGTSVGSDLVFLDLETDQYSCLPCPQGVSLKDRLLSAETLSAARPLVEAGYLGVTAAIADRTERTPPERPSADLRAVEIDSVTLRETGDFLLSWVEAVTRLPGRSLLALHLQVRADVPDPPEPAFEAVARRVSIFDYLVPWVPFPGPCMFRSYFLLRFLQRGGLDARWVIGVRTWPFEAHCWLQIGQIVLDERCERLVRYEPLLAI